jgi:hypothetical protein
MQFVLVQIAFFIEGLSLHFFLFCIQFWRTFSQNRNAKPYEITKNGVEIRLKREANFEISVHFLAILVL